jgi:dipeptidyl aminopeptidase/acylaminoacyl peptidase
MKRLALNIGILVLGLLLAACGAAVTPSDTPRPNRSPGPTPCLFAESLHIAVTQYVGQNEAEDRPDPFHPARLLVFSDQGSTPEFTLVQDGTSYSDATWSPDGQWLAYVVRKGSRTMRLEMRRTDWQSLPVSLTTDYRFGQLNGWTDYLSLRGWSADGTWLAFDYVSLMDSDQGYKSTTYVVSRQTKATKLVGHDVTALAWSPVQPSQLAYAITPAFAEGQDYRASLYLASVDTLANPKCLVCDELRLYGKTVCSISWSPSAESMAFSIGEWCDGSDTNMALWVGDPVAQAWPVTKTVGSHTENLRWSKDGRWLACGDAQQVMLFAVADWSVANAVDVSPYGSQIVLGWSDEGALLLTRPTSTGSDLLMLSEITAVPCVLRTAVSFGLGDSMFSVWSWSIGK